MSSAQVEGLLQRLVAQFESPYDFLRELVQNAMDAGSDRVEVTLESHPTDGDEVVYELTVVDTGAGMDETVIDNELTRLFSSGKAGDRTMAGGFGIGFVSVFAWEPDAVLLQTGRSGEAWELLFRADKSFEKVRLDVPVEGTTVILFRQGRPSERAGIAEAVRDSLWRWCRFAPLEVTFEDLDVGEGAELIQDSPEPLDPSLSIVDERGDSRLRVSFGVPPHAVLLRQGLILAEGAPAGQLPEVAGAVHRGVEHLQVWADSPLLRTTMARDKVVDDAGRDEVGRRILEMIEQLRASLFGRVERWVALEGPWTAERHLTYGMLLGHLLLETERPDGSHLDELRRRRIVRLAGEAGPASLKGLRQALKGWPVLVSSAEWRDDRDRDGSERAMLDRALAGGIPVLVGDMRDEGTWLLRMCAAGDLRPVALSSGASRLEPLEGEAAGLCDLAARLLGGAGLGRLRCQLARFIDHREGDLPLFGVELDEGSLLAYCGDVPPPASELAGRTIWLNRDHVLTQASMRTYGVHPLISTMSLAMAVLGQLGSDAPEPGDLAAAAEGLRP